MFKPGLYVKRYCINGVRFIQESYIDDLKIVDRIENYVLLEDKKGARWEMNIQDLIKYTDRLDLFEGEEVVAIWEHGKRC